MTLSNQPLVLDASNPAGSSRRAILSILIGCAILFGILQIGVTKFSGALDQTWAALITATVMLVVAVALEKLLFKRETARSLSALGFGRPTLRALSVATIITLLMLGFFPIFSLSTGAQVSLKQDWLWILLAIVTFNGIGEETLFRGFVLGGLRRDAALSFRRACLRKHTISQPLASGW